MISSGGGANLVLGLALSMGLTLQRSALWAQAGRLEFTTPVINPLTGVFSFEVHWKQIELIDHPVRAVNIWFSVSGISVCLQPLTFDPMSIHPDFQGYVNSLGYGSIQIFKFLSQPFLLEEEYVPLMRVYFRAAPGTTATLQATFGGIWDGLNFFLIQLPPSMQVTMPNPLALSGLIRKVPGASAQCSGGQNAGITNVEVTFRANTPCYSGLSLNPFTTISPDGSYTEEVSSHYSYSITPYKNSGCECGLDDGDVNVIRSIILGNIESPTLAQLMAGDFNASGAVTTFDIVNILQCRNGTWMPPSGWSAWRFISIDDYDTYNSPPINVPDLNLLPSSIITPIILTNQYMLDFYGIKRGDVDGSCTNCNQQFTENEPALRNAIVAELTCSEKALHAGTFFEVLATLHEEIQGASTLSFSLNYDAERIEVLTVEPVGLTDDFWHVWQAEEAAVVKVFWMSMHSSGQDLAKGEQLFRIHARAKQTIEQPNDLFWQSASSSGNLYFHNGSIGASLQLSPSKASNTFRVKVIGPNPTRDKTDLLFMMPESGEVELLIYDARGILLAQNRYALSEGHHSLSLDDLPDIQGIYTILTRTPFSSQTVRIIRF